MAIKFKENKKLATWQVGNVGIESGPFGEWHCSAELLGHVNCNMRAFNIKNINAELQTLLDGAPG